MSNPFDHQNPTQPADFLDRDQERATLRELIEGGRNILVYGPRRRGKTSLVLRVFEEIETLTPLYADATRMKHPGDLGDMILAGLADTGIARTRRFLAWAKERLQELELEAGVRDSGVYVRVRRGSDQQVALLHALEFLERIAEAADARFVVCLDEFQVVMQHEDGIVDAIRSVVQHQKRVQYIFSGSAPSVLAGLNHEKGSPFYQQLTEVRLDGIDIHAMRADAERLLTFRLEDEAVKQIHGATGDNTKRVVQVLRHLYDLDAGGSVAAAQQAITASVHENTSEYERILSLVKPGPQRLLLMGLAEDQPEHVTGSAFIARHGLQSSAHVLRASAALRRLEIIDQDHRFLDRLFRLYLIG